MSCVCGAGLDVWDQHLDELLNLFVSELHAYGGPRLDVATLRLHLHLYVAMIGLTLMIDTPALVVSRLPEIVSANGPLDPMLRKDEVARNFPHVFTAFLNLWQTQDLGASLDQVLTRTGHVLDSIA